LLFDDLGNGGAADNLEGVSLPKTIKKMSHPEKQDEETAEPEKHKRSIFDKILGRNKEDKGKTEDETTKNPKKEQK